ncbi:HD domain-containing phosphohydrolase, partial [uncultured Meiothermus sp.]|uniref:HD-GYP domain-containing protein n=1 Tax=uncultured Meiothermus sp. TaxID=157471 RepID=UPI00260DB80D
EATGNPVKALSHHRAFYQAERSVFNAENERKTRQLEAQFDLEKLRYEVEIARTARMEAEMKVAERTAELEQSQLEMLNRLAIAAEYRDDQTGQHTLRVGRLAAAVARALHWLPQEADILDKAARLHDIGKIGIPDEILLKSEKLTAEEFERMKQHTIFGAKILSGGRSRLVRMAEEIARAHHEHWDGNGYPYGLEGQQIPIEARIVAVIDMFDALTHERPYKRAWSKAEALEEIRAHSGSRFDPSVVQAALGVLK